MASKYCQTSGAGEALELTDSVSGGALYMDEQDRKTIADAIAAGVAASVLKKQDSANEVAFALLTSDVKQLRVEMDEFWRWKKENEAVILWARNFMDTYRRTMGAIVISGAITVIGLLIQVYYTLNKGK